MPLIQECHQTNTAHDTGGFGSTGHTNYTTDAPIPKPPTNAVICNATPNNSSDSSGDNDIPKMPYYVYLSLIPFDHISQHNIEV